MHLKSICHRDGWLCTRYGASSLYDGSEGELYNLNEDPEQRVNLWDDEAHASVRTDLVAQLEDVLPPARSPQLERQAPV